MSIAYYTKLCEATPMLPAAARADAKNAPAGQARLLIEALRLMLAIYQSLRDRGKLPAALSEDDADETISAVAAECPALIESWDPARGELTTYLYAVMPRRLLRVAYKLAKESARYETGVFDIEDDIAEDGQEPQGDVATDGSPTGLPISDLIYAEPPLGMMDPAKDALMSEKLSMMQAVGEGTLSPRDYCAALGLIRKNRPMAQHYRDCQYLSALVSQIA